MIKVHKKLKFLYTGDAFAERLLDSAVKILKPMFNAKITLSRSVALFLIFFVPIGISGIGETRAYFNDTESSSGNLFEAAFLDFFLSEDEFDTFIGKEALGEYSVASVAIQTSGSLDIQYAVNVEKISGDDDFCNGLLLEATKNGIEVHDADVFSFSGATSTTFGTWEFEYDLPPSVTTIGHGDECDFDIVYTGWRADSTPETSGFDDEERIRFELISKMVVMNEILPNPTGRDSQSGLLGEWVELYNNGDTSVDVAGWTISELADPSGTPTEKFYTIVSTTTPAVGEVRTFSGSTIIAPGGFLVILFEAQRLNNDGDTVTLYDGSLEQMDQHEYVDGEAPEDKAIARIPDGIGAWVDPIPTPGAPNIDGEVPVAGFALTVADLGEAPVEEPVIEESPQTSTSTEEVTLEEPIVESPSDTSTSTEEVTLEEPIVESPSDTSTSTEEIISEEVIPEELIIEEDTQTSTSTEEIISEEAILEEPVTDPEEQADTEDSANTDGASGEDSNGSGGEPDPVPEPEPEPAIVVEEETPVEEQSEPTE